MATINSLRERIKNVNVKDVSRQSVDETKEDIIQKQKDQLFSGLNSKGEKIGQYRSNKYARVKNEINPLPGLGVPDLKLTGAFYSGIDVQVTDETINTDSTDKKSLDLQAKYGPDIFGLDPENKGAYVRESLRPVFITKIKNALSL